MARKNRREDKNRPDEQALVESAKLVADDHFEQAAEIVEIGADETEEEEKLEPAKVEVSPIPTLDEAPSIQLKVFAKIAGPKWDQMAGFISHAKLNKIGPRTVKKWRATYQSFLKKPIKSFLRKSVK